MKREATTHRHRARRRPAVGRRSPRPSGHKSHDVNVVTSWPASGSRASKLTKAAAVYRGFTGATLPATFFKPNEENVCGGIEYGFSSTTTAEEQAHHYAAGKASTVFEMRMGLIDRGAEVDWLSQCAWAAALEALSCPRLLAAPHPTGVCPLVLLSQTRTRRRCSSRR